LGRDELEIVRIAEQQLIMAAALLDLAKVVLERVGHSSENTYAARCELSGVPASTLWHRDHDGCQFNNGQPSNNTSAHKKKRRW
jgi:hypothetical protein